MDTRIIARLAEIMGQHGLAELEIEEQGLRVRLRRDAEPATAAAAITDAPAKASEDAPCGSAAAPSPRTAIIASPLVGTFYTASSPDAEPLVAVGTAVKAGATVCIIEAMKVMNEVKAEQPGVITRILVDNKTAVEYGTPLFEMQLD